MSVWSQKLVRLALAAPLLILAPHVHAQTLTITFDANVFGCTDPTLNGTQSFSFTSTGQTSGADTLILVDLGSAGTFTVPVPTSSIDALAASVGQSISIPFSDSDPTSGCVTEGTLIISVSGAGGPLLDPALEAGNEVTTPTELDAFVRGPALANSNRIRSALRGAGTGVQAMNGGFTVNGMAAGNGASPRYGAWFGYSYTDAKSDFASTAFSADRHSVLVGIDTMPGDNWLLGVSFGLERSSVDTRFNAGEQTITGMTLAPYVGVLLGDWLTFDASAGVSTLSMDQFRTQGAARVTSDVDSTRLFANANLAASHAFDRVLLTGLAGMLYATQRDDDFRESNGTLNAESRVNVGRLLLGGEAAYTAGAFEPYVSGTFEYDFTKTSQAFAPGVARPKNDDTDVLFAVGVRYFGDEDISGSIEYSRVIGRSNLDEDTFSANVRWPF